jgi:TolB-like protein/Flp pilus assembly protein TadD
VDALYWLASEQWIGHPVCPNARRSEAASFPVMSLFSELTRRNVFKIGVAYVVVAWVIMQVTDLAAPALRLPEWVASFVVFLLLIGFPIALLLAWAYEVTPEGIKKTKDIPLGERVSRLGGRKLDFVIIVVLAAAVLLLVVDRNRTETSTDPEESEKPGDQTVQIDANATKTKKSIAVLAFANMSEDPNQEHFADGLSEELLNGLAALEDLSVISRTSSFSYKGRGVPLTQIAAELQVDHILEGSVRRAGNTVRVTAQLIDTSSDSHLWSETFDRELNLDNILQIQDEIAVKVVDALQLQLLPGDSAKLKAKGPANLEALDLYHDGMVYLRNIEIGSGFEENLAPAIEILSAAIAADPDWAPPYAALGRVYHFAKSVGDIAENLRISKEFVMQSIRLDDTHAPAYNSLGYILTVEGDYEKAMDAYDHAISLGTENRWGYAILLAVLGRHNESIEAYRQAMTHDPLSVPVRMQHVEALSCAGKYEETIVAASKQLRSNPDIQFLSIILADALIRSGSVEEGLRIVDDAATEAEQNFRYFAMLAVAGREESARAALKSPELNSYEGTVAAGLTLIALGEPDRALSRYEESIDRAINNYQAFSFAARLQCYPEFQALAGNPRYQAVLQRLGLEQSISG